MFGQPVARWRRVGRGLQLVAAPGGLISHNARGKAAERLVQDFYRTVERIAHPAFRDDEPGLRRIRFNLAAQPGYLNVNRAVIDLVVVHATRLEELVAC